jgi:hypothetical protein
VGPGHGAQESILKAAVANSISPGKRARAFGLFNTALGLSWFIGSIAMGRSYDINLSYLVNFSIVMQALAIATLRISLRMKNS